MSSVGYAMPLNTTPEHISFDKNGSYPCTQGFRNHSFNIYHMSRAPTGNRNTKKIGKSQ
jgi:hypothetical protein